MEIIRSEGSKRKSYVKNRSMRKNILEEMED
jgi:hypothetical protein